MQFCKLEILNLAYLYISNTLTKHFAREQNCLKMSKHRNKSIKIKYKAKNERNKTTENERKSNKKEIEKEIK